MGRMSDIMIEIDQILAERHGPNFVNEDNPHYQEEVNKVFEEVALVHAEIVTDKLTSQEKE